MNAPFRSILKKSEIGQLFEVKRSIKDVGTLRGFLVASSDSLLLFHRLDSEVFQLNGYTVIRDEDISRYRVLTAGSWEARALSHYRIKPKCPTGISIVSFPELLKSVAAHYPLMVFHPEKRKPDVCYIGPLVSMTERTFTIEDLNSDGKWSGPRRMRFGDISRIDFGGGYESALAVTAPNRTRSRKR